MAPLVVSVVTFEDTQVASPVPTTFNWSAGGRCRKPRSWPGWEVTERSATFLTSPRSDQDAKRAVAIDQALKEYIYAWRNVLVSYERFVETVFSHMMQVYEPVRLRLVLLTRPPGGISSITVDSDWAIGGGKEQFRHRVAQTTPGE
jgi:hypothetical protein